MKNGTSPEYELGKDDYEAMNTELRKYFIPSLHVPLLNTCEYLTKDITIQYSETINTGQTTSWSSSRNANYAIYSGYPGQIVKPEMIDNLPPLIHMHAGLLPNFRGSTTTFYSSILNGNSGVTSMILSEKIDTGPIITSGVYPEPTLCIEYDHLHDSIIRSDLLIRTLSLLNSNCKFDKLRYQTKKAKDYYVIHPVLKHIALMCASNEVAEVLKVLEEYNL